MSHISLPSSFLSFSPRNLRKRKQDGYCANRSHARCRRLGSPSSSSEAASVLCVFSSHVTVLGRHPDEATRLSIKRKEKVLHSQVEFGLQINAFLQSKLQTSCFLWERRFVFCFSLLIHNEKKTQKQNKNTIIKVLRARQKTEKKCTQEHLRNALKSLCLHRNNKKKQTHCQTACPKLFKYTHALQEKKQTNIKSKINSKRITHLI